MGRGKTTSNSLFELIKSLTRTEKRYFKLYISRHSPGQKSVNEKLFNAISDQDRYNEIALKDQFKHEEFSKSFSVAKTRLYNNIIDSLQFFHSGKSVDNTLFKYLTEIEILYQKSLYRQCSKILKKALKLAEQSEKYEIGLVLYRWRIRLAESTKYLSKDASIVESDFESIKNHFKSLENEYELLHSKTIFYKQLYAGKVNKNNDQIDQLIRNLGTIKQYNTNKAKLNYYQMKSAWYFALNQHRRSKEYSIKALDYITENELEIEISILGNVVYTSISIGDFTAATLYLDKLKSLQNNRDQFLSEIQRIKLFENIASLDLYLQLKNGHLDQAYAVMAEVSKELSKFNGQISALNRASFYFNFAQICLLKKDYKGALAWINQLLNYPKIDQNERIFSHGLMLSLIVHYELQNYDYIQSKIKSIERYLTNRNRLNPFEIKYLHFMKLLSKNNSSDRKALLVQWKKMLNTSLIKGQSNSLQTSFNLLDWIDGKINEGTVASQMD